MSWCSTAARLRGMSARTSAHLTSIATILKSLERMAAWRLRLLPKATRPRSRASKDQATRDLQLPPPQRLPVRRADMTGKSWTRIRSTRSRHAGQEAKKGVPFAGEENSAALGLSDQATFHPLRYLKASQMWRPNAAHAFMPIRVVSVEERDGTVTVVTEDGSQFRRQCVVASNAPVSNLFDLHSKQAPVSDLRDGDDLRRDTIEDALYWDTLDPYHYVRLERGPGNTDYLLVGGATTNPARRTTRARGLTRSKPGCARAARSRQGHPSLVRAGFLPRTRSTLRLQRPHPATSSLRTHRPTPTRPDSRVIGSLLISRLIPDRKGRLGRVLRARPQDRLGGQEFHRREHRGGQKLRRSMWRRASFIRRRAQPAQGRSSRRPRQNRGLSDESGTLHRRSAVCSHLGCHIHWKFSSRNAGTPVPGSQFSIDGAVLNAPAYSSARGDRGQGKGDAKLRRAG